jgi:ADP-heptose:LPS heptosyltransferase
MTGRPTILILRALGLGDLLTAVPALRALARARPDHRRILATPRWLWPIVRLADVAEATVDARPFDALAARRPDVAVNLHGRGPESHRALLATRPRRLISFEHPEIVESRGSPEWSPDEHEVVRWCRLLAEHGIPANPTDLALASPTDAPRDQDVIVVHPGATSGARRWPPARWIAVARSEALRGRRVVVTGSAGEVRLAEAIVAGADLPAASLLAGRTDLVQLADVVARAGLVLSGDTGIAHLATALGTPSVTLFGPTSPAEWGPPDDRPWHVALWAGTRGDPHGRSPDEGLLRIEVEAVLRAAARARAAAPVVTPAVAPAIRRRVPA